MDAGERVTVTPMRAARKRGITPMVLASTEEHGFFADGEKAALLGYTPLSRQLFLPSSTRARISMNLYGSLGRTSFIFRYFCAPIYQRP